MTQPADLRVIIVQTRMTSEQAEWVKEAAEREGITPSKLIRRAVGIYLFGATGPFKEADPLVCNRPHKRAYRRRVAA